MSMQNDSSDRKRVTRRMTDESKTMEAAEDSYSGTQDGQKKRQHIRNVKHQTIDVSQLTRRKLPFKPSPRLKPAFESP